MHFQNNISCPCDYGQMLVVSVFAIVLKRCFNRLHKKKTAIGVAAFLNWVFCQCFNTFKTVTHLVSTKVCYV